MAPTILITSPQTAHLLGARGRDVAHAKALAWHEPMDWPAEDGMSTARLHLEPAGHILGAAQLVVEHQGRRLVYTGDYRSGTGRTHAAGAPVVCDELIVESTFALPIFRFPPRERVMNAIAQFCRQALQSGQTPVLLAYALGKAQELVHLLLEAGIPVVAHGAVYKMCQAYEALGVALGVGDGRLRAYVDEKAKGPLAAALIAPPSSDRMVRTIKNRSVATVSGWALLDRTVEQRRADAGFVLSDHADHDDLVATVEATRALSVTVTHGDAAALAAILSKRGIEARALERPALDADDT